MVFDRESGFLYTSDHDSRVVRTQVSDGAAVDFEGDCHGKALIKYIALSSDREWLYTVGSDDVMFQSPAQKLILG